MRNFLLAGIFAVVFTSCSILKDKPRDDRGLYEPRIEEPILPPLDGELLATEVELDGLGRGYETQTIDQTSLVGINIPSQEELIAVAGDRIFFPTDSHSLTFDAKSVMKEEQENIT